MAIRTAGPQHAAVNFAQKDPIAFLPVGPLEGTPPSRDGGSTPKPTDLRTSRRSM